MILFKHERDIMKMAAIEILKQTPIFSAIAGSLALVADDQYAVGTWREQLVTRFYAKLIVTGLS